MQKDTKKYKKGDDSIETLILEIDLDVTDKNDFFQKSYEILLKDNFVEESFLNAILERESKYPTGLNLLPIPIAIPHIEPIHIKKPFIMCVRLKEAIKWCEMATDNKQNDTKYIFVLGLSKENAHIDMLERLIGKMQQIDIVDMCKNSKTKEEYEKVMKMVVM